MTTRLRYQFLTFNGILLVSYYEPYAPYNQEKFKDLWHIPGREIMSTDALITLAEKRQVPLNHTAYSEGTTTTTRLA